MAVDGTNNKAVRVTVSKAATKDVGASFRTAVRDAVVEKLDVKNERLASFAKFTSVLGSDCVEGGIVMLSPAGTVRGSTKASTSASLELGEKSGGSKGAQSGRFLVRLSDSLFLAPQSDSKKKRHSKELHEKRPNPGCFWFTTVGGSFFWRCKNLRVASLVSERQKRRR
jgi:hypothetical protein